MAASMLLITGVVILSVLVVLVSRRPENGQSLGWMSDQWLAEYRASHYE